MRKLQASLTLRSLRHGKESTNAILLDDDNVSDDMTLSVHGPQKDYYLFIYHESCPSKQEAIEMGGARIDPIK